MVLVEAEYHQVSKPFFYQQQRVMATSCYLMHFNVFVATVALLQEEAAEKSSKASASNLLKNVIILHSTGRCGSTLLSKLLDNGPNMASISEPDVFTALTIARADQQISDADYRTVARASAWLLAYREGLGTPDCGLAAVAIKMRSFVVLDGAILHDAIPEAKVGVNERDIIAQQIFTAADVSTLSPADHVPLSQPH